ncbi:hypothetical protein GOBAR_DD34288 [Gossypium barbadense]|nr:hypothetical protein GOBAR_DD34288 [Gossypium barbadense]
MSPPSYKMSLNSFPQAMDGPASAGRVVLDGVVQNGGDMPLCVDSFLHSSWFSKSMSPLFDIPLVVRVGVLSWTLATYNLACILDVPPPIYFSTLPDRHADCRIAHK